MTVRSLDFAFLSARFSLSDFPDFFDMDLRGDLSDIIGPSIGKPERSRCLDGTPNPARTPHRRSTLHDHWWRGADSGICDHTPAAGVLAPCCRRAGGSG